MTPAYVEIHRQGIWLWVRGRKMAAQDLAKHLATKGLGSKAGKPYDVYGRGIYAGIAAAYREVEKMHGTAEAAKIAEAFTKPSGGYAYET